VEGILELMQEKEGDLIVLGSTLLHVISLSFEKMSILDTPVSSVEHVDISVFELDKVPALV
jgi:hypothetical protein